MLVIPERIKYINCPNFSYMQLLFYIYDFGRTLRVKVLQGKVSGFPNPSHPSRLQQGSRCFSCPNMKEAEKKPGETGDFTCILDVCMYPETCKWNVCCMEGEMKKSQEEKMKDGMADKSRMSRDEAG